MNERGSEIIFSADKYLDVSAKGFNKGSSVAGLINHLQFEAGEVLVAGDTMNDLALYQYGFKGVIVGNAEMNLLNRQSTCSIFTGHKLPGQSES